MAAYSLGLKQAKSPHRPIVCVGNLQVGGTGKSPVARFVAQAIRALGRTVVLSCSGYGSPHSADASLAPDGPLDAREWGDEPAMMRWLEPNLPLIVGRDRVLAATIAHTHFPDAVLVLDDGFQHLPLRKQVGIVIDPPNPDNRLCLPAGPYREPRWNRSRADLVLPSQFCIEKEEINLFSPEGTASSPDEYSVLCALGQPQKFLSDLERAFPNRAPSRLARLLPDHDPLDAGTLLDGIPSNVPIVVTAKDWVKLRERTDLFSYSFLIATHNVRVEPLHEFCSWLENKLNEGD
jgi:tetraacyldisaccharide 4'-kinase